METSKCLSTDEQIRKMWDRYIDIDRDIATKEYYCIYIYTKGYYSAIKRGIPATCYNIDET